MDNGTDSQDDNIANRSDIDTEDSWTLCSRVNEDQEDQWSFIEKNDTSISEVVKDKLNEVAQKIAIQIIHLDLKDRV